MLIFKIIVSVLKCRILRFAEFVRKSHRGPETQRALGGTRIDDFTQKVTFFSAWLRVEEVT